MGTFDIVNALEEYLRATCAIEQDPSQDNELRRTRAGVALIGAGAGESITAIEQALAQSRATPTPIAIRHARDVIVQGLGCSKRRAKGVVHKWGHPRR
jgi:hypothetical protein